MLMESNMPTMVTRWFGTFLVEGGKVVEHRLFPKDARSIADRIMCMRRGEILEEERELAEGRTDLLVAERRQVPLGTHHTGDLPDISPSDYGYPGSLLSEAMLLVGSCELADLPEDQVLVQEVRTLEDLTKILNLISERLTEWNALYSPEEKGLPERPGDSGMEVVMQLHREAARARDALEADLRRRAEETCPALSRLLGPVLAAKMVAAAGSLERLSRMPSSTIQVLGAEKAFFRHLTSGAPMPKHGLVFQHPVVHNAPKRLRGKISRVLSGKVAIASRMDFHGNHEGLEALVSAMESRIARLREEFNGASDRADRRKR